MATVVLLTRVNLKEESMLLLPETSFPTEGDSFPRLISPEPHLDLKLIDNLSLDLFAESKNIFGKIGKFPRESWLKHFDIMEMKKQMEE